MDAPTAGPPAPILPLALRRARAAPLWLIPTGYVVASVVGGFAVPRLERLYLPTHAFDLSAAAAISLFSSVASGAMAFTGIVFAVAFVVVQFGAVAYSPRLVVMFADQPRLYHAMGLFFATFAFSLAALSWTDRGGSGAAPLACTYIVLALLIASMLAFAGLIQSIHNLQIQSVLTAIGARGRRIVSELPMQHAPDISGAGSAGDPPPPLVCSFIYAGEPATLARVDFQRMSAAAREAGALIVLECAVGDTLLDGAVVLRVHGAAAPAAATLRRAFHVGPSRTFEQDPKYAIRLLVDVAIRALSPAVNDPTTAVQTLDQIEDLVGRLGGRRLDTGQVHDAQGALRVIYPTPEWEDYLSLAFDEIRQFGAASLQVMRRLRAALSGLAARLPDAGRRAAVLRYLEHLDATVRRGPFDEGDRETGLREDRQGLGSARARLGAGASRPG